MRTAVLLILSFVMSGLFVIATPADPHPFPTSIQTTIVENVAAVCDTDASCAALDGEITEDSPEWDCTTMGNGLCAGEAAPIVWTLMDGSTFVACHPYGALIERHGFRVCVGI